MIVTIVLLCVIGAVVLWDKLAIGEFGISQPIVACPLLGLFFGEFHIGLLLGGVLQLVWVGTLPLGGKEPMDNQTAGIVAIATYILARKIYIDFSLEKVFFISLFLGGLASIVGQKASQMLKTFNNRLYVKVNQCSSIKSIISINFLGLATSFIKSFIVILVFLIMFVIVSPTIKFLPNFRLGELIVIPLAIGVAGLAKLLIFKQRRIGFSIIGALAGIVLWVILR